MTQLNQIQLLTRHPLCRGRICLPGELILVGVALDVGAFDGGAEVVGGLSESRAVFLFDGQQVRVVFCAWGQQGQGRMRQCLTQTVISQMNNQLRND